MFSSTFPCPSEIRRSKQDQQMYTKIIKGWWYLSCKDAQASTDQPGEENTQRDLTSLHRFLTRRNRRGAEKMYSDHSHSCPKKGPAATNMNQENLF